MMQALILVKLLLHLLLNFINLAAQQLLLLLQLAFDLLVAHARLLTIADLLALVKQIVAMTHQLLQGLSLRRGRTPGLRLLGGGEVGQELGIRFIGLAASHLTFGIGVNATGVEDAHLLDPRFIEQKVGDSLTVATRGFQADGYAFFHLSQHPAPQLSKAFRVIAEGAVLEVAFCCQQRHRQSRLCHINA